MFVNKLKMIILSPLNDDILIIICIKFFGVHFMVIQNCQEIACLIHLIGIKLSFWIHSRT